MWMQRDECRLEILMDAMQDCVNINSESVGRGIDMLMHKRTWFAISWNIEILRIPKMFEEIKRKDVGV